MLHCNDDVGRRGRHLTARTRAGQAKLSACVQLVQIRSTFSRDGAVKDAREVLVLVKTRTSVYDRLQQFVCDNHPCDVPEILQIPMTTGHGPYLSLVNDSATATVMPGRGRCMHLHRFGRYRVVHEEW